MLDAFVIYGGCVLGVLLMFLLAEVSARIGRAYQGWHI